MLIYPTIKIAGEDSVIIYVGDGVHERFPSLLSVIDGAVRGRFGTAILDTVPSYVTIHIHFDTNRFSHCEIIDFIRTIPLNHTEENTTTKTVNVPVCYDPKIGIDLLALLDSNGLTLDELITLHSTPTYVVQAVGFIPGMPFLAPVHEKLVKGRHSTPQHVHAGSVGIAGTQTGIYPIASPGGWQIIGRTPLILYDEKAPSVDNLLKTGDRVKFTPISYDAYVDYCAEQRGGLSI